jgi:hypothetical protein
MICFRRDKRKIKINHYLQITISSIGYIIKHQKVLEIKFLH